MRPPDFGRRRAGMTLIEVLTALMMLSLVAIAISVLLLSARQSHDTIRSQNLTQKAAQRAADTMMDGLRAAQEITAGDDTLVCASFKNGDTVSYYLEAGRLKRDRHVAATGQTVIGEVVCDHVAQLTLKYFALDTATGEWHETTPAVAQSVAVSLRVADEGEGTTETSMVRLRNKSNT